MLTALISRVPRLANAVRIVAPSAILFAAPLAASPAPQVGDGWRRSGPEGGPVCRVFSAASQEADPRQFVIAGRSSLYRGGVGEAFVSLGAIPGLVQCAATASPLAPARLFAVGRLASASPAVAAQLLVSEDGGRSWRARAELPWEAGAYSTTLSAVGGAGAEVLLLKGRNVVLRSEDGGRSFVPAAGLGPGQPLVELVVDESDTNIVYLARGTQGVWISRNGGRRFVASSSGLAEPLGEVVGVAPAPDRPGRVYALVNEPSASWRPRLYRSDDRGRGWRPMGEPLSATRGRSLLAGEGDTVFVTAAQQGRRLWRSGDGGVSMRRLQTMPPEAELVLLDATVSRGLAVFGPEGLFRSRDGGASWQPAMHGIREGSVVELAVDPADANALVGLFVPQGLARSVDGGRTWTSLTAALARDLGRDERVIGPVVSVAGRPRRLIVGTSARDPVTGLPSGGFATSIDRGNHWAEALALGCRRPGSLVVDPTDYLRLVVSSEVATPTCPQPDCYVSTSVDGGGSWSCLDAALPLGSAGGLQFAGNGDLYASDRDGLLRSLDRGATWERRGSVRTSVVAIDAGDPARIYATGLDDGATYRLGAFRSDDAGETWQAIGEAELPPSNGPNLLVADPQVGGRLVVATPDGLFRSDDAGERFTRLEGSLSDLGGGWVGVLRIGGGRLLVGTSSGLFVRQLEAAPAGGWR
jgi:photosystem II stability/assembly factor-like uncharacterized protein